MGRNSTILISNYSKKDDGSVAIVFGLTIALLIGFASLGNL